MVIYLLIYYGWDSDPGECILEASLDEESLYNKVAAEYGWTVEELHEIDEVYIKKMQL